MTHNPYKEDKIENFGKILITHYHYSTVTKLLKIMEQIWLHLLSLSGLLSLTLCRPQEYVLITEAATWGNAQEYCRKNHVDLATVQSNEDWTGVTEVGAEKKYYGYAWYGLYNDINSWRWSYQDESLVFKAWYPSEPDNYASGEECVAIASDRTWRDRNCDLNKYFLCSDESENATEKIVLIKNFKTWLEAQQHCRKHYTDLVTIRSLDDNIQATKLTYAVYEPWIGLYRDSWKWSDQANFTSSTQLTAQNLYGGTENCAGIYWNTRLIDEYYCTGLYYFFCGTGKSVLSFVVC
ncbi:putative C-type lectin domain family 20 member A [Pseudorasbora parva]|uniref:putative C-type lectin domain family 20 member A n=1 Tax=Pseudorasbora parva TaxID=51549 RepID=UPI00351DD91C